jgi:hypothetical protein
MYDMERIASREKPRSCVLVESGAECPACAGHHDDPRVVVLADRVERLVQRLDERKRHRVESLRLVERDDAHVRANLAIEEDQSHPRTVVTRTTSGRT